MKARVKWYDAKKRYGYLTDEEGKDRFFHASEIKKGKVVVRLDKNDEVEFEPGESDKGLMAANVTLVNPANN